MSTPKVCGIWYSYIACCMVVLRFQWVRRSTHNSTRVDEEKRVLNYSRDKYEGVIIPW